MQKGCGGIRNLKDRLKTYWFVERNRGFSANQIKWIALITMTVDHLAAYGFEIPVFKRHFDILRIIGRISAPIFLFLLTESIKHTRSKGKFLLRLYFGAVGVGLFISITNLLFDDTIGRFSHSNILFDYVYTTLYIILIEQIWYGIKQKEWKRGILILLGVLATCIPHYIYVYLENFPYDKFGISFETVWMIKDFTGSFIRSPLHTEYTILFIIMGNKTVMKNLYKFVLIYTRV